MVCPTVSPCAERFSDSPSAAILAFHDRKHSFDGIEARRAPRKEKQRYPYRTGKIPNARGMVKCHLTSGRSLQ